MRNVFLRFKDFKLKALTLSYDDGRDHDRRLVAIMQKYGIKGTFNVPSSFLGSSNSYVSKEEAFDLYIKTGNEVAIHGEKHLPLSKVPKALAVNDVMEDRKNLEKLFSRPITGMAYAYGAVDDEVIEIVKNCGITYARAVETTENFNLPENFLRWEGTCHHDNPKLMELADKFLSIEKTGVAFKDYPKLFYVWGHSYEFDRHNNWEVIEEFCKKMGGKDDIWYATNGEIYEYVTAFNNLVFSADGEYVFNPSGIDVYINCNGKDNKISSMQTVKVK